ncbi:Glucose-methanol-choline oxidoreductase [Penicillium bovifimosum]|uniref:Glucose-methanol-choline oxidoreductase n=1 Tax=Penicillium bovifimosum TaxID=126998 RepID=A0A9W9H9R6_9EURO|nr:Glucose-methanol-choline oxidoreductase [Penicillium bovifimosum]KAJ5142594.1 Glucose-methanol-choline oxidoreductase [Penicillium bovifimosum]
MAERTPATFDFIIVGGGTAGNVVAGRLAENPNVKILVIEAGAGNPDDISMITTPARAFELRNSKYDWSYQTTFVDKPDYERLEKPNTRGKVLGGSSCLNYFTWVRGSKETFNSWGEYGGDEWTWEKCEQYFQKPASYHDDDKVYNPPFTEIGRSGPIHVSHANLLPETRAFRDALTKAWTSKGHRTNEGIYNGNWKASPTASAPSTTVLVATKINFEGDTAVSVTVVGADHNEVTVTVKASREIIIAGGVFETPKLLLLSGIGPRRELARHGIGPVIISPHVGEHLLDHPILPHVFRLKDGLGLDHFLLREGPDHDAAVEQYNKDRTGPLASGLLEMIAFPRIDERLEQYEAYRQAKASNGGKDPFGPEGQPHFEIDFVPMFCDAFQWHFPIPPEGDWLTVIVDLLRPQSRGGYVRLNSVDPREQPDINLNYFSDELDILALREGVRFIDDILTDGNVMKDLIAEDYPWPMPRESNEEMNQMILDRAQTGYHPCGTARLSRDIEQGVVDPELRVHGAKRLRIVDASIVPVIPDCRIQNAIYMIGEKGADIIKAAHPDIYE